MTVHHTSSRSSVDVAGNVRAEVARARISQTQLAEALGHNQQWVNRRMLGGVEWTASDLLSIADLLGIHPAVLLGAHPPVDGGPDGGGPVPQARVSPRCTPPTVIPFPRRGVPQDVPLPAAA